MFRIIVMLVLVLILVKLFEFLYRKWKTLDLEEKKNDIEETEEKHKQVTALKKNHPNYERQKKEVNEFENK